MVFERFISINWSGAARETKSSGLRIVQATEEHGYREVVTNLQREAPWWKRTESIEWLVQVLQKDR